MTLFARTPAWSKSAVTRSGIVEPWSLGGADRRARYTLGSFNRLVHSQAERAATLPSYGANVDPEHGRWGA
jgi:hypothetical protein